MGRDVIHVATGEVKVSGKEIVLCSTPIGSCVVVILFDGITRTVAMAHIMLPDYAPESEKVNKLKYAGNAIENLIGQIIANGADKDRLKAVIVGGGNVLKRKGDHIGRNNIMSVKELIGKQGIPIFKKSVGGQNRKIVWFDIEQYVVYFTDGNSERKILVKPSLKKPP